MKKAFTFKDGTIGGAVDQLTYASYRTNRDLEPDIKAERWGAIYGKALVKKMEIRYQKEIKLRS
jgi:hypothetical protein|tara:strand:+ start:3705 stop:3896 length:192 start_codon:yes stop_codon:yes gene_type:complete